MKKTSIFLLTVTLVSCLKEEPLKKEYSGFVPVDIQDGWTIGSCQKNQIDSAKLNTLFQSVYEDENSWPLRSMLVFRNGELIGESYMKDDNDRINRRAVWDCSAQILGILYGILADSNEVFLNDRLQQFLGNYMNNNSNKANITMEDLLTMRSGISYDNEEDTEVLRKKETESCISYVLGLDLDYQPGSHFNHSDGDALLLSAVFENLKNKSTDEFAGEVLFSKIGFSNYNWQRYKDGVNPGGFGLSTTGRELAKIGQLVLNKGKWNGSDVVSETWVDEMLAPRIKPAGYGGYGFGYQWWTHEGKKYYMMAGRGGQYVILLPEKNGMLVLTSLENIDEEFAISIEKATSIADQLALILN